MAGQGQQRLVNKQFNSPIGLYSEANVREILDRESQMLANGAVGIDFHNPMSGKPANLQNSAVLRMLEEQEHRQRNGQADFRRDGVPPPRARACWPPPGADNRQRRFRDVVISGVKRVAWPPPKDGEDEFREQEAIQAQGGPQFPVQQSFSPTNQQQLQHQKHSPTPTSVPVQIQANQSPQPYLNQHHSPQQHQQQPRNWAPSPSFNSQQTLLLQQAPQQQFNQTPVQQQQQGCIRPQSPQPYSPNLQQQQQQTWAPVQQPQQQFHPQPAQPQKVFEPPPTTITLRPAVPISQAPAPIVTSQPATATLRGGKNLRGDMKWPPENVKERMDAENRQRMELARGPACRPRRVEKDYSGFFAQHALNSSYPGYKIPPGTQFYEHQPMM